ncbi:origin recognition complex subunit 1, putative (macronuclear) [Tetrahymena thermophila SB210]|uniref:Origin recognition complex subunit 1 n=1 Tax=Tetrahymena thermophila (strain SB210) TaxID=312017 RepID=Q24FF8_TETTS|nr:origin recognition complex subunit 1, putative [Tetrahymena thermophila SB210]EAS06500.2 origin recognition complex subunit 1, putative [Tetrahymena thermophila SB210]|eukprot:XP_001026745.2 origin recognition complex subunit 1, putative [Tetrahymena thermophila SB210]
MNTRNTQRSIDPKKGKQQQKSVSKSRSKSNNITQSNEKIKRSQRLKSKDEMIDSVQEPNIFVQKDKNKQQQSKSKSKNSTKESEKKPQKRAFKIEIPKQNEQKLKKTQESNKTIINLTKQQKQQLKSQQLTKAVIEQQIHTESKKREYNKQKNKNDNLEKTKNNHNIVTIDSSNDENESEYEISDCHISVSVYNNDNEIDIDKNEQSVDVKQNKNKNMIDSRGRSKNSLKIKKTYSSSQQKSQEKQQVKESTASKRITRSQQNFELTELQDTKAKSASKNKTINSEKQNQKMNSKEKIDTSKDKNPSLIESEKPKRGRKPKQVEILNDKIQEKETDQQKTPKKRGRKSKQEALLDRRNIKEIQQQKEYEEKQQKKSSSKESQKLTQASEHFNFQALIYQQKPAKKELRIEDKNYQKINVKPKHNIYDQAIEMLQEYSLPEEIPCREDEKKQILEFINEGLGNNGSSNCLYISGVPGIGKTASFLEVIKKLQNEKKDEFTFIHINAMNLSNPENLYYILVKTITGKNCTSKQKACQILNELFTRGKLSKTYQSYGENIDNKNKVILLDELDYLVTQDQDLLYNLMEWPHHKYSKLTIIGIANTMNLPEILMNKIKSRMGSRRLVFNQYNHKQIQEIIATRLKNQEKVREVFEQNAIEYTCRKIAISSSDIRKTLKVLRKAVEICQLENFQNQNVTKVTIPMIQKSYSQLYSSPILYSIQKLQFHHKLMILSIALENKHRGIPVAYLSESYNRYRIMLSNLGKNETINYNQMKMVLNQLSVLNLIQLKEKEIVKDTQLIGLDPNKKHFCHVVDIQINSNFSVDDVTNSLKEDEIYLKFQHQF